MVVNLEKSGIIEYIKEFIDSQLVLFGVSQKSMNSKFSERKYSFSSLSGKISFFIFAPANAK